MKTRTKRLPRVFGAVAALACLMTAAHAQDGRSEVRATLGYSNFIDESPLHHFVAGGSLRYYLTGRFALEPEFLYMYRSHADQDFVFIPNLTWDLAGPTSRVIPYLIGGAGVLRHRELTGAGYYSSNSWTGSGGLGVKFFLKGRLFVAPEFRLGLEPILRMTGSIGFATSR